ncbi:hypothetical protein [Methylophilus sp. 5]|uniref:hypothetical protein n=1 Tax=Methylophilus sp. 5 TaxID=1112274 RepID=UPI00048BBCA2|nr:hypothetical protein [Methylophilus sp. 5]
MRINQSITLTALVGAVIALYFEAYAANGLQFLSYRTGLLMTAWTLMPYLILFAGRYFFEGSDIQKQWLHFGIFEVLVVAWIYWQTLVMYPDAQGGLIFLFLPLLQASLNLVVGGVLYWAQRRLKHRKQ